MKNYEKLNIRKSDQPHNLHNNQHSLDNKQ